MSYNFRKGAAALEEAATRKSGGRQFSFVPRLRWREDGESHFVLVLTPIEDVVTVLLHEWIPVGKGEKANGEEYTRWEDFISRRDPAIDGADDELQDRLEREPKLRSVGVVVELEPQTETVNDRQKVVSFIAKTETYTKKTEDDDEVEMTQPAMALVTESAITLWGAIGSLDQSRGPIADVPVEIIRRGKDQNTRYDLFPLEVPVDLSPVIEYLDGISYLADEQDEILAEIARTDTELEGAQVIANALLSKRLNELADSERYDELVNPLKLEDMPKPFGGKKTKKTAAKRERPARQSRREAVQAEPAGDSPTQETEKTDRFAALKARVEGNK